MAAVSVGSFDRATRCRITSESDVVVNIAPDRSRSARICRALTRFPLWASASGPRPVANTIGWALIRSEAPAVE
jgi:hypothetical protein